MRLWKLGLFWGQRRMWEVSETEDLVFGIGMSKFGASAVCYQERNKKLWGASSYPFLKLLNAADALVVEEDLRDTSHAHIFPKPSDDARKTVHGHLVELQVELAKDAFSLTAMRTPGNRVQSHFSVHFRHNDKRSRAQTDGRRNDLEYWNIYLETGERIDETDRVSDDLNAIRLCYTQQMTVNGNDSTTERFSCKKETCLKSYRQGLT